MLIKSNNRARFLACLVMITAVMFITGSNQHVIGQSPVPQNGAIDKTELVGLDCEKYGIYKFENMSDPESPAHNPKLHVGQEKAIPAFDQKIFFDKSGSRDWKEYWGTMIYSSGNGVDGVYAYQQISTTLTLDDSEDILYAPTLIPPNKARLEILSVYYFDGMNMIRGIAVVSHSTTQYPAITQVWATTFTSSFLLTYVRTNNVTIKMLRSGSGSNQVWDIYLWNWLDSQWNQINIQSSNKTGESAIPVTWGWDMWEECYMEDDWPTLPELQSYALMVLTDDWYFVTSTYGEELDSGFPHDCPYDFTMIQEYYWWSVS